MTRRLVPGAPTTVVIERVRPAMIMAPNEGWERRGLRLGWGRSVDLLRWLFRLRGTRST